MTDRELLEKIIMRLDSIESDVQSVKLTLENDVVPSVNMSLEYIRDHSERLQTIEKSVQAIQDDLEINVVIDEIRRKNIKMN